MKNKTLRKTSKKLNKRKKISGGEVLMFERDLGNSVKNLLEGVKQIEKNALIDLINMYTDHQNTIIGLLKTKENMHELIDIDHLTGLFVAIQKFCHKHLDKGLHTFILLIKDIIKILYNSGDINMPNEEATSDYLKNIMSVMQKDYNTCSDSEVTCKNTKGVLKILHSYVNILHNTADLQMNEMLGYATLDLRKLKKEKPKRIDSILCIVTSLETLGNKNLDGSNTKAVKNVLTLLRNYLKPFSLSSGVNIVSSVYEGITNSSLRSIIKNAVLCSLVPIEDEKNVSDFTKQEFNNMLEKAGTTEQEWGEMRTNSGDYFLNILKDREKEARKKKTWRIFPFGGVTRKNK